MSQDSTLYLNAHESDDRRFLAIVSKVIDAVPSHVRDLVIVRVNNWFDHKWLRFSGIGRVPFEDPRPAHPGVALEPFFQEKLTFPPFTPRRILREECWTLDKPKSPRTLIHPRILQNSAHNLHRRVVDFSDSMVAIWFSSRTEDNRRGCVMQYRSENGKLGAWYASLFVKGLSWRAHLAKSIDRRLVEGFLLGDDGPPSGDRRSRSQ